MLFSKEWSEMHRFVVEPVLFSIFGELLHPQESVEYVIPHSTIMELYELRDSEQIVTDPSHNQRVKEHLGDIIAFFEQPFVRKKIEKSLRVPWQKSSPILFSEHVSFTVVYALDNAEFGESFDPIETEMILTARNEKLPMITDQLEFQKRIVQHRLPITVIDVADFGFLSDEPLVEEMFGPEDDDLREPLAHFEAEEGAVTMEAASSQAAGRHERTVSGNKMLPWVFGGLLLVLTASLFLALK
jgi:hypothetical protein